jgi:hypothetical protein
MNENDKADFRRMMGGEPREVETEEEVEARRERLESDEGTFEDIFSELPEALHRAERHYLGLYGLKPAISEEEEAAAEAAFELMSEEQHKVYSIATSAYSKRGFPSKDPADPSNSLASFAATNPPEVLRRHVWRLQRRLDEPIFGRERDPRAERNRVDRYAAALSVELCKECAEDLREETEHSGAELFSFRGGAMDGRFYERGVGSIYLFRFGRMFVQRKDEGFMGDFPYSEPKTCERCGVSDVEMWREQFGDAE